MSEASAKKLRSAAEPYSISAATSHAQTPASVFLLPPAMRVLQKSDEEAGNVWVKGDDIQEILLFAGTPASEDSVNAAIHQLRNFLPGIISGKFCLQVRFLQLYFCCLVLLFRTEYCLKLFALNS